MLIANLSIEDEQACTQLVSAFAYCVDHQQYVKLSALFIEDGVFERPGSSLIGRSEILSAMAERPVSPVTRHVCGAPLFISASYHEIEAVTPLTLYQAELMESGPPQFEGPAAVAEYIDRFQRTAEGWRIAERRVVIAMVRGEKR